MGRRLLIAMAAVAVAGSATVPARALKQSEVLLGPGQTVTRTYEALAPGVSRDPQPRTDTTPGAPAPTPRSCETKQTCDAIPIRFAVPAGARPPARLVVTATWPVRATASAARRNAMSNQLNFFLWRSPPSKTAEGFDTYDVHFGLYETPPQTVSMTNPTAMVWLVAENLVGVNEGYTVSYTYVEANNDIVDEGPPVDRSIDDPGIGPLGVSDDSGLAGTASFPAGAIPTRGPLDAGPGMPGAGGGDGRLALDVLAVGRDASLDAIGRVTDGGGLRAGRTGAVASGPTGPPAPGDVSGAVVAAWLAGAPAVAAGLLAAVAIRRRRTGWSLG